MLRAVIASSPFLVAYAAARAKYEPSLSVHSSLNRSHVPRVQSYTLTNTSATTPLRVLSVTTRYDNPDGFAYVRTDGTIVGGETRGHYQPVLLPSAEKKHDPFVLDPLQSERVPWHTLPPFPEVDLAKPHRVADFQTLDRETVQQNMSYWENAFVHLAKPHRVADFQTLDRETVQQNMSYWENAFAHDAVVRWRNLVLDVISSPHPLLGPLFRYKVACPL